MYRLRRHHKFTVSNRLALAAALVLCLTALAGGTATQRAEGPFGKAVDAIAQQAGEQAEQAARESGGLKASILLLRGR